MLQVFQTYVSYMFSSVSDVCCKCFSYFGRMLQVFYLDVVKVDLMLQRDPLAATASWSCLGVVHARGKQRRMEAGARVVPGV
jgi:hypothetical protein